ncbi:hypothetical protein QQ045_007403 [Rhodiola kirilowii]
MVPGEASQNTSTEEEAGWQQFLHKIQLPDFAVPTHYDLRLKPDMTNFTFSGSVRVLLNITSPTEFLVFNAYKLEVLDNSIQYDASSEVLKPVKVWKSKEDQIVVLEFSKKLPLGTGNLTIGAFGGNITDNQLGYIKGIPYSVREKIDYMAVTQFEPLDARRCFPCWDEPALKATFNITLDVQSNLTALSNMPIIEEELQDNWKTLSYEVSPVMPTYAVAVVVGMFDYVENITSNAGTKVRVYGPVDNAGLGKFSLDVAVRSLDIFKRYLNVRYPLPKLDMVGIPSFRDAGMENFGLITCQSTFLYVNNNTTMDEKRETAILVAHEVAHMWFGDLVTMKWWKYFWLNEGFATWFNYYAVDQIFPEWEIWAYFTEKHGAASLVSNTDSRSIPIEVEVNSFKDLYAVMNSPVIMYHKAAYIIQMLYTYLGPQIFQHSIASYIKEFSWSSVDSENLWTTIEKVSGKPVKNVMSQWTKLTGYPVVSVETSANNLLLKQVAHAILVMEPIWGCPWIKVNVNLTGFFRVMYDNNLSTRLAYVIQQKNLSHFDRFGILNDLNALSVNYNLQFHYLFALMDAYVDEDNLRVISALTPVICSSTSLIVAYAKYIFLSRCYFHFSNYKKHLCKQVTRRLGLDSRPNEGIVEKELRSDMLKRLAILGDESTLMEMTTRFEAYVADNNSPLLHPDIKEAAFIAVMQKANKSNTVDYETLLRIYNVVTNDNPDEQQPFLINASPEKVNEVKDFFTNKTLPSFNIGLESSILQINKKVTWAQKIREEKGLAEFIDNLMLELVVPQLGLRLCCKSFGLAVVVLLFCFGVVVLVFPQFVALVMATLFMGVRSWPELESKNDAERQLSGATGRSHQGDILLAASQQHCEIQVPNGWRKNEEKVPLMNLLGNGLYFKGALHWVNGLTVMPTGVKRGIVVFSLAKEKFERVMPLPEYDDDMQLKRFRLRVVCGKLTAFYCSPYWTYTSGFQIWVMERYGVKESWTKKISITDLKYSAFVQPISFLRDDSLLLNIDNEKVIVYDPKNRTYNTIESLSLPLPSYRTSIIEYVESLGSTDLGRKC